jgi:hypothetical protein
VRYFDALVPVHGAMGSFVAFAMGNPLNGLYLVSREDYVAAHPEAVAFDAGMSTSDGDTWEPSEWVQQNSVAYKPVAFVAAPST